MAMPGHFNRARKPGLLAQYADTFGEMQLRKYTERAIRAARAEAELNSRSKSAFLATMSHELRTPLNAIIGFSDLIQIPGAASPSESADYAQHISRAGRRLLEVVSDVLDMSRLEAGLPEFEGDTKRLRQLFGSLLSNASKFTAEKGRVLVMAKASKDAITIAIADTGVGMTHEQIVLAMKPFAQVQGHLARTQEGAGLGLPLALGLARLHGGSLHLDSQPGAGTTAIVNLPRNVAAAARPAIGKVA